MTTIAPDPAVFVPLHERSQPSLLATAVAPLMLGLAVVAAAIAVIAGQLEDGSSLLLFALAIGMLCAWVGIFAAKSRYSMSWGDLGFRAAKHSLWHLIWAVPVIIAIHAAAIVAMGRIDQVADDQMESFALTTALENPILVLTALVILPVLAAILTSWITAHSTINPTQRKVIAACALSVSALFLGLMHVCPPVMFIAFGMGLLSGVLFLIFDSLWAPIVLHTVNNLAVQILIVMALPHL